MQPSHSQILNNAHLPTRASRIIFRCALAVFIFIIAAMTLRAQTSSNIYWGNDVPKNWNGNWPEDLRTVAERTGYTRTMSVLQLHEFIAALKLKSEYLHVVNMFTSPLGKVAP